MLSIIITIERGVICGGFSQIMSAVAHQGTWHASYCWCNVNQFYSCDCVGNCFSWSERQIRLLLINDGRLDSIKVLTGFFFHGSTVSLDLGLHCEEPQIHNTRMNPYGRLFSPSQRHLSDNTRHLQATDIHVPGEIWTRNPSQRAAADLQPRLATTGIG
jgi:hypothetical protein